MPLYRIGVKFLLVPLPYFRLTEIIGTKTSTAVDENEKHISDRYHKKNVEPSAILFSKLYIKKSFNRNKTKEDYNILHVQ